MKHLLKLSATAVFCFGVSVASAQTVEQHRIVDTQLEQKQQAVETSPTNYDSWKQEATDAGTSATENRLIKSEVEGEYTTHYVKLGKNLADANAAEAYKNKLASQPGIISITVDHNSNMVIVKIKTADEHHILVSAFDIQ